MSAAARHPTTQLLDLAHSREATGDLSGAWAAYNQAIAEDFSSFDAAMGCARTAALQGDWALVQAGAERAIGIDGRRAGKAFVWLAQALTALPRDLKAIERLDEAARSSAPPAAYEALGMMLLAAGKPTQANLWLRRHCLAAFSEGRPIAASAQERLPLFITALAEETQQTQSATRLAILARLYLETGRLEEAALAVDAVPDSERSAELEYLRGVIANQLGQFAQAEAHLQHAAQLGAVSPALKYALALSRERLASPIEEDPEPPAWSGPPLLVLIDPMPRKHLGSSWFLKRLMQTDRGDVVRAIVHGDRANPNGWIHPVYCGTNLRLSPKAREMPGQVFLFDLIAPVILDAVRRGEGALLIDHGCEGLFWTNLRDDGVIFRDFLHYLDEAGIPADRIVILDGNLQSPQIAGAIAAECGLPAPTILAGRHAWMEMVQIYRTMDRLTGGADERLIVSRRALDGELRSKAYLSFNAAPRPHRVALVGALAERGLLSEGHVSFSGPAYIRARSEPDLQDGEWEDSMLEPVGEIVELSNPAGALANLAVQSPIKVDVDLGGAVGARLSSKILGRENNAPWPYLDSYLSVVTDTAFSQGRSSLISEKLSRPIANLHLFINVGEPGTLAELRRDGYRTFGGLIDERYDDILDRKARMMAIIAEVERLSRLPINQLHALYCQAWPAIIHNYRRFMRGERLQADRLIAQLQAIAGRANGEQVRGFQ